MGTACKIATGSQMKILAPKGLSFEVASALLSDYMVVNNIPDGKEGEITGEQLLEYFVEEKLKVALKASDNTLTDEELQRRADLMTKFEDHRSVKFITTNYKSLDALLSKLETGNITLDLSIDLRYVHNSPSTEELEEFLDKLVGKIKAQQSEGNKKDLYLKGLNAYQLFQNFKIQGADGSNKIYYQNVAKVFLGLLGRIYSNPNLKGLSIVLSGESGIGQILLNTAILANVNAKVLTTKQMAHTNELGIEVHGAGDFLVRYNQAMETVTNNAVKNNDVSSFVTEIIPKVNIPSVDFTVGSNNRLLNFDSYARNRMGSPTGYRNNTKTIITRITPKDFERLSKALEESQKRYKKLGKDFAMVNLHIPTSKNTTLVLLNTGIMEVKTDDNWNILGIEDGNLEFTNEVHIQQSDLIEGFTFPIDIVKRNIDAILERQFGEEAWEEDMIKKFPNIYIGMTKQFIDFNDPTTIEKAYRQIELINHINNKISELTRGAENKVGIDSSFTRGYPQVNRKEILDQKKQKNASLDEEIATAEQSQSMVREYMRNFSVTQRKKNSKIAATIFKSLFETAVNDLLEDQKEKTEEQKEQDIVDLQTAKAKLDAFWKEQKEQGKKNKEIKKMEEYKQLLSDFNNAKKTVDVNTQFDRSDNTEFSQKSIIIDNNPQIISQVLRDFKSYIPTLAKLDSTISDDHLDKLINSDDIEDNKLGLAYSTILGIIEDNLESIGEYVDEKAKEELRTAYEKKRDAYVKTLLDSIKEFAKYGEQVLVDSRKDIENLHGYAIKTKLEVQYDSDNAPKENWQISAVNQNSYESASKEAKAFLESLVEVNSEGKPILTKEGLLTYVGSAKAFSVLINELPGYFSGDTFIDELTKLSQKHFWLKPVVEEVEENPDLAASLYTALRKQTNIYIIGDTTLGVGKGNKGSLGTQFTILNGLNTAGEAFREWKARLNLAGIYQGVNDDLAALERRRGEINESLKAVRNNPDLEQREKDIKLIGLLADAVGLPIESAFIQLINNDADREAVKNTLMSIYTKMSLTLPDSIDSKTLKGIRLTIQNTLYERLTVRSTQNNIQADNKNYYNKSNPSNIHEVFGELYRRGATIGDIKEALKMFNDFGWYKAQHGYFNTFLNQINNKLELLNKEGFTDEDVIPENTFHTLVYTQLKDHNGDEYQHISEKDRLVGYLNAFFNWESDSDNKGKALVRSFNYSDADVLEYVSVDKLNHNQVRRELQNYVQAELNRIKLVKDRERARQAGEKIKVITHFDKNGSKFCMLPRLNAPILHGGAKIILAEAWEDANNTDERQALLDSAVDTLLQNLYESTNRALTKYQYDGLQSPQIGSISSTNPGLVDKLAQLRDNFNLNEGTKGRINELIKAIQDNDITYKYQDSLDSLVKELIDLGYEVNDFNFNNSAVEKLRSFAENDYVYFIALNQLINVDPAFYKDPTQLQKRQKQAHSDSRKLYFSREVMERSLYLDSIVRPSSILKEFERVINKQKWSEAAKKKVIKDLGKISVADGQSFRTLESYLNLLEKMQTPSPSLKRAIENYRSFAKDDLKALSETDRAVIFQSIKSFTYGPRTENSGFGSNIRIPTQHKNSETPLVALLELLAPDMVSPQFKGLINFAKQNNIDVIHTSDAVKVGFREDSINIEDFKTQQEVEQSLAQKNAEGNIITELPIEYYGVQVETPPHLVDTSLAMGIQIKKLITGDIKDDAIYEVDKKVFGKDKLTGEELKQEVHRLYNKAQMQRASEIEKLFSSNLAFSMFLQRELQKNPDRVSNEVLRAIGVRKTSDNHYVFDGDLHNPEVRRVIEPIVLSFFKKNLIEHKFNGGTGILVSDSFLSSEHGLEIKVSQDEEGNDRIEYVEIYMPAYTKELYEHLVDPKTGLLTIPEDMDENLLKGIGYRVPTEAKYSTINFKVKGFLPQEAGSSVVLPADFVVFAGWDFK